MCVNVCVCVLSPRLCLNTFQQIESNLFNFYWIQVGGLAHREWWQWTVNSVWDSVIVHGPLVINSVTKSSGRALYPVFTIYMSFCNYKETKRSAKQTYLCYWASCHCWSAWVSSGGICRCSGSGPVRLSWVGCCRPHTMCSSAAFSPFSVYGAQKAGRPLVIAHLVLHPHPGCRSKARHPSAFPARHQSLSCPARC